MKNDINLVFEEFVYGRAFEVNADVTYFLKSLNNSVIVL